MPRVLWPVVGLLFVLALGTSGYYFIEDRWSVADAVYMTVITISTVGFSEIHNLSSEGRVFTIVLIVLGWTTLAMFAAHFARVIVETEVHALVSKQKMRRRILKMTNHYIVCGYGRIGGSICTELAQRSLPFVVVEAGEDRVAAVEQMGYCAIKGDATTDAVLKQAGIETAAGVVAALAADKDNLFISLAARELNPTVLVVSRAEEVGVEDRILRAGADIVVSPMKLGGQQIAQLLVQQTSGGSTIAATDSPSTVLGFSLRIFRNTNDAITTVAEATVEAGALTAVAVKHQDGSVETNPDPGMEICSGDSLVLFAKDSAEELEPIAREVETRKILLADDHKALRMLFARKIRASGHEVITAADGLEALQFAQEHRPDLIVLDVMMPRKTGYEVCEILKAIPGVQDTPVVLYSATETEEFFARGKECGAAACIRKTSKSTELLAKIEQLLHGDTAEQAEAPPAAEEQTPHVLEPIQLLDATDGDLALIEEVVTIFLQDTAEQLGQLAEAVQEGEGEAAERTAHNIKGAAANMGCSELAEIAAGLERAAREGSLDRCRDQLGTSREAFTRAEQALQKVDWPKEKARA